MTAKKHPVDIDGKIYNRTFLIVVLLVGAFCTMLNQTLLSTALPSIMKDFDITAATGQWLTTGFLLMNGIMIPVSALLINKISSKTLYTLAMVVFLAGTILAAVAANFSILLTGRIIQAAGAGVMMPLMQTIFLLIFPKERRGTAMGMVGIVIAFAPAVGPTLSGWIVDTYNWRYLFYMIIPISIIVILLSFIAMKKVVPLTHPKIDSLSIILSTLGFGGLLYGFSSVGNSSWFDPSVIIWLIVGAVFVTLFIWRQIKMKEPMLEFRVFESPIFTLSVIISSVVMMALIGAELIIPLYIQNLRGETAFHSGLMLLPGAIIMGLMSPITGIMFDRIGARRLAITGIFLLTVGTLPFTFFTTHTSYLAIIVFYAFRVLGMSMVMMPVSTAGMNALPNHLMSHGTAVNNTIRTVSSSIGTAVLISILTNVTKHNMPEKQMMHTDPAQYAHRAVHATLDGMNMSFFVVILFSLVALALSFLIKNTEKQSQRIKQAS